MTWPESVINDWVKTAPERAHQLKHSVLRSQAKCDECDYQVPMDGPDRIVAALDRLTAAVDRLAERTPGGGQ